MCKKFFLLMLQIGLGAVFVIGVRGQEESPSSENDENEGDNSGSGSSDSVASIIGFSVVLSLLLLALCIVTLLCFRYGTCKCVFKRPPNEQSQRNARNRPFIPGLLRKPSRKQPKPQDSGTPTMSQPLGATNPSFAVKPGRGGGKDECPPLTPTRNSHSIAMFPRMPHYDMHGPQQPQKYDRHAQQGTHRLPTLLAVAPTEHPSAYPVHAGFGYPYQPCKSPRANAHHDIQTFGHLPVSASDQSIRSSSRRVEKSSGEGELERGLFQYREEAVSPPRPAHNTDV